MRSDSCQGFSANSARSEKRQWESFGRLKASQLLYTLRSNDAGTTQDCLVDVGKTQKVSEYVPPFVAAGVHPLLALMGLHAIYPVAKKALQTKN